MLSSLLIIVFWIPWNHSIHIQTCRGSPYWNLARGGGGGCSRSGDRTTWPSSTVSVCVKQTGSVSIDMAVLTGSRTLLLQALRVPTAGRERSLRLAAAASLCARRDGTFTSSSSSSASSSFAARRHYSSESRDDLRVRYLDGEDTGKLQPGTKTVELKSQTSFFFSFLPNVAFNVDQWTITFGP